jgi:hypothetical protein
MEKHKSAAGTRGDRKVDVPESAETASEGGGGSMANELHRNAISNANHATACSTKPPKSMNPAREAISDTTNGLVAKDSQTDSKSKMATSHLSLDDRMSREGTFHTDDDDDSDEDHNSPDTSRKHSLTESSAKALANTQIDREMGRARHTMEHKTSHGAHSLSAASKKDALDKATSDTGQESDDGNAWCGCVCGITHDTNVPVFWIQCEKCLTWYSASSRCLPFAAFEVEFIKNWTCWGCPLSENANQSQSASPFEFEEIGSQESAGTSPETHDANQQTIAPEKPSKSGDFIVPKKKPVQTEDGTYVRPTGRAPKGYPRNSKSGCFESHNDDDVHSAAPSRISRKKRNADVSSSSRKKWKRERRESRDDLSFCSNGTESAPSNSTRVFKKGDVVYISEHAWSRVNNPAGIATVTKSYIDDDNDQLYDIKYVVGDSRRGVLAKYVSHHEF